MIWRSDDTTHNRRNIDREAVQIFNAQSQASEVLRQQYSDDIKQACMFLSQVIDRCDQHGYSDSEVADYMQDEAERCQECDAATACVCVIYGSYRRLRALPRTPKTGEMIRYVKPQLEILDEWGMKLQSQTLRPR